MAYFVPFGGDDKETYDNGVSVAELFPVNVVGLVSGNDEIAVAPTKAELARRVNIVRNADDETTIRNLWGKKFDMGQTAKKIQNDVLSPDGKMAQISYRPFDSRWTYYSGNSCGWIVRPRDKNVMGHLLTLPTSPIGENISLIFCKTSRDFFSPFVSKHISANRMFSAMCETAYLAPLYLHGEIDDTWTANIDPEALARLTEHMSFRPEPIEVFDYCYGILHDPVYRERFNEFLKRDFPRVPTIESEDMFCAYAAAGGRLRRLHLMQEKVPAALAVEPNAPGDMGIGAAKYRDGALHLNASKRILGIAPEVWEYRIGGYQVLDKWLKSHRGESLTLGSFEHICNVAGVLAETIKVQEELRRLHGTVQKQSPG
jgi:predicted helicase